MLFESLPVELIAEILSELDLPSLIKASYLSKRLYLVASDTSLNPWRRPILRNLRSHIYEDALKHLSVRLTVPRQNWIEILSLARPSFVLFEATLPNLKASEWEECFRRRFLPGWLKWKKDCTWRETFIKILHRVWHRSVTSCTTDESWTKSVLFQLLERRLTRYIVLNRNGSANELEMSSRNFNPFLLFNELKLQNDLGHLETRVKLIVELADVRILAFGTLARPRSTFSVNLNALFLLRPPGIKADIEQTARDSFNKPLARSDLVEDHGVYPLTATNSASSYLTQDYHSPYTIYARQTYPLPAVVHANYPFFTPGGADHRWVDSNEDGLHWVGSMMIVAQILPPSHEGDGAAPGRNQFASFSWSDLWAIAPWLDERITKRINGPGLGN